MDKYKSNLLIVFIELNDSTIDKIYIVSKRHFANYISEIFLMILDENLWQSYRLIPSRTINNFKSNK